MRRRYPGRVFAGTLALAVLLLVAATVHGLAPVLVLNPVMAPVQMPQWRDRDGQPLNITYRNAWNLHDLRPLHAIPELLRQAVVQAEDQRFLEHQGVDWVARTEALRQNLKV